MAKSVGFRGSLSERDRLLFALLSRIADGVEALNKAPEKGRGGVNGLAEHQARPDVEDAFIELRMR